MLANFWPPTSRWSSVPRATPPTPDSTTTITHEYPPRPAHDTHYSKHGPPPSSDVNDEATLERLEHGHSHRTPSPAPLAPQQREKDRVRQQLEALLAMQRDPESAHESLPPPSLEESDQLRQQVEREEEKDPGAAAVAVVDALKEENEKLKTALRQRAEQLDIAQIQMKQERYKKQSEVTKLRGELDVAHEVHKREVERLKTGLQEHAQRVEQLIVEHEHGRKDGESVRGSLNAEIGRLKLAHAKETEQFKMALEDANGDRMQAHLELRDVRKSLNAYIPKLDESLCEMDALRRQLSDTKDSNGSLNAEIRQLKLSHAKEMEQLNAARETMKQEHLKMQSEVEKSTRELNTTCDVHKAELETLELGLQEHAQQVERLTADRERLRKDGESIRQDLNAEIRRLRLANTNETGKLRIALEDAKRDRTQALSEMQEVRKSLDVHIPKLDESLREIDILRRELSNAKDANGNLSAEIERLNTTHAKEIERVKATREGMKQQRSKMQYEVEKLRGELNAVREAHKEEKGSIRENLSAETERLKLAHARETEQLKAALEEANHDLVLARLELGEVRKLLDAYTPELDESRREIEALHRELSNTKDSNRATAELKQRLDIQSKELQSAQEESSALKKEFKHLLTHLEDRTSEPQVAQNFLRRADAFSGTEITSTLQKLNAEVMQSTAFMAESMVELFLRETTIQVFRTNEQMAACTRASHVIGGAMVHFLGTKRHKDDPILIQIAFQACLTYHLRWITCAWIIGGDENQNRFIDTIYHGVHEKEAQTIAGRWRAITRAHVPSTPLDESQTAFQIANNIVSHLSDILLATKCNAQKSDIVSALSSKFGHKLSSLASLAMHVNKIIGEDVTSGDFEVTTVLPATAFDLATMEDSYDSGRPARAKRNKIPRVLCTTDLGLTKKTRVGMTGENQWETKVLLKPKVALESVIDILDE